MKNIILHGLAVLCSLSIASPGFCADQAWIMSVPFADSSRHVYKVRIQEIDDSPQVNAIRYPVEPGNHTITVSLILDVEWEPKLSGSAVAPSIKQLQLDAEAGKSYQLAAQVDIGAPAKAQLDQSYWEPFIYRIYTSGD